MPISLLTSSQTIALLKKFDFFKNLEDKQLQIISEILTEKEYAPGELLIEQGDHTNSVFFIINGHVKVYLLQESGKEINLAVVGPWDTLGEISVITKGERTAYCSAIEPIHCLVMHGEDMEKTLLANPSMAIGFLRYFAQRILKANKHIEDITSASLKNRTFTLVETLAKSQPNKTIDITQETLAEILSATRPRVTETLQELATEKKIKVLRGMIQLL